MSAPLPPTPTSAAATAPTPAVVRATRAVSVVFVSAGVLFASWASRIPQVRSHLALDTGQLGALLLALAIGSLLALPVAGIVVGRFGERRAVAALSVVAAVGVGLIAIGLIGDARLTGAPSRAWLVPFGLFVAGAGFGIWDVAMNVHATVVERHLGRTILPRFHAGYSVGTVAGALLGAGAVAVGLPVPVHFALVAGLVAVVVPAAAGRFLADSEVGAPEVDPQPDAAADLAERPATPRRSATRAAWTDPRTLLIGLFVLCMALSEGTGNDWLSVAMIDGYGAAPAVGVLTFAVFLSAMTAGRWFVPPFIDTHGRVVVLRWSAATAAVGLVLVVFGSVLPLALLGAALWGLGTAVGFPVGISAAADDPTKAAARVSVTSSIGYVAFLAGPPSIGLLAGAVGTLHALMLAAALLALGAAISRATAPLQAVAAVPASPSGAAVPGGQPVPRRAAN